MSGYTAGIPASLILSGPPDLLAENSCWMLGWKIKLGVKRVWHFYYKIRSDVFIKMGFSHQLCWGYYAWKDWLNILEYDYLSLLQWTQALLTWYRRLWQLQFNKCLCCCLKRYTHIFEFSSISMTCNNNKNGGRCSDSNFECCLITFQSFLVTNKVCICQFFSEIFPLMYSLSLYIHGK